MSQHIVVSIGIRLQVTQLLHTNHKYQGRLIMTEHNRTILSATPRHFVSHRRERSAYRNTCHRPYSLAIVANS